MRRLLGSGWIPASVVFVIAAATLRDTGNIAASDILAFTAWLGWSASVPGVVAWRAVDWRGRGTRGSPAVLATGRPFLEDVVLGTILGLILSIPAYLLAVGIGAPVLVFLWPLLVLLPAALTRSGRALLLRRQANPYPPWWTWCLAALMLYVVAFSAQTQWLVEPLSRATLTAPHLDEPYHLSLIGEFRHHFPAQVPFVAGTPLKYHWLIYPFIAAGSWGSGVEPVILLRLVAPASLSAILVLGVAVAASRLSGRRWAAPAAVLVLCLAGPLDVLAWTPDHAPWLGSDWLSYKSPTQALANALCPLLVVLLVGMLRGAASRSRHWLAVFVVMLAVAGAKSAMLPLFVAGLCGTTLVMVVIRRRPPWVVVGLATMSLVVFGLATVVFYGSGSRAMTLGAFQIIDYQASTLGFVDAGQPASTTVRLSLTSVFVLCAAAPLLGAVGLFVRGGWRRPVPWMLLGCWLAGLGVYLVASHPGFGQAYFYRSTIVPAALLVALGWVRAAGPLSRRTAAVTAVSLLAGLGWAWLVTVLVPVSRPDAASSSSERAELFQAFGVPILVAAFGVLVAAVVFHVLSGGSAWAGRTLPAVIALVLGMTLITPVGILVHGRVPDRTSTQTISDGGITAARWLRAHSDPDQLVATNVHTPFPRTTDDHRQFWISAYSERRMLVEGWAYIPPESVGLPSNEGTNRSTGAPFWQPEKLRLNDEVFTDPSREKLEELHDRYGVDWLFVDRRRNPDLRGLRELGVRRFASGDYVVFRITESAS